MAIRDQGSLTQEVYLEFVTDEKSTRDAEDRVKTFINEIYKTKRELDRDFNKWQKEQNDKAAASLSDVVVKHNIKAHQEMQAVIRREDEEVEANTKQSIQDLANFELQQKLKLQELLDKVTAESEVKTKANIRTTAALNKAVQDKRIKDALEERNRIRREDEEVLANDKKNVKDLANFELQQKLKLQKLLDKVRKENLEKDLKAAELKAKAQTKAVTGAKVSGTKPKAIYSGTGNGNGGFIDTVFGNTGSGFGHKLATTSQYALAGSILFDLAGAFQAANQAVILFDQNVANVEAVLGATNKEARTLTKELEQVGVRLGGTFDEINQAALALGRAGLPTDELAAATDVVVRLATLTGDSITDSTQALSSFRQVFADSGKTVTEFGGELATAANISRFSIQDIGTFSNFALAAGKNLGLASEQILVIGSAMSNFGINASTAGTQFRKFANIILDSGDKADKLFSTLGLNQKQLVTRLKQGGKSAEGALNEIFSALSNASNASYAEATEGLEILTKQMTDTFREIGPKITKEMITFGDESKTSLEAADKSALGLQKTLERVKNTLLAIPSDAFDSYFGEGFKSSDVTEFNKTLEITIKSLVDVAQGVGIVTAAYVLHRVVIVKARNKYLDLTKAQVVSRKVMNSVGETAVITGKRIGGMALLTRRATVAFNLLGRAIKRNPIFFLAGTLITAAEVIGVFNDVTENSIEVNNKYAASNAKATKELNKRAEAERKLGAIGSDARAERTATNIISKINSLSAAYDAGKVTLKSYTSVVKAYSNVLEQLRDKLDKVNEARQYQKNKSSSGFLFKDEILAIRSQVTLYKTLGREGKDNLQQLSTEIVSQRDLHLASLDKLTKANGKYQNTIKVASDVQKEVINNNKRISAINDNLRGKKTLTDAELKLQLEKDNLQTINSKLKVLEGTFKAEADISKALEDINNKEIKLKATKENIVLLAKTDLDAASAAVVRARIKAEQAKTELTALQLANGERKLSIDEELKLANAKLKSGSADVALKLAEGKVTEKANKAQIAATTKRSNQELALQRLINNTNKERKDATLLTEEQRAIQEANLKAANTELAVERLTLVSVEKRKEAFAAIEARRLREIESAKNLNKIIGQTVDALGSEATSAIIDATKGTDSWASAMENVGDALLNATIQLLVMEPLIASIKQSLSGESIINPISSSATTGTGVAEVASSAIPIVASLPLAAPSRASGSRNPTSGSTQINITNESGTPVDLEVLSEVTKTDNNGEEQKIINVVMRGLGRNSGLRNAVKAVR